MNVEGAAVERGSGARSCRGSTPAGASAPSPAPAVGVPPSPSTSRWWCTWRLRGASPGLVAGRASRAFLPAVPDRGPSPLAVVGLAGAADPGHRADGARVRPHRGRRQRLADARARSTATTSSTGSASRGSRSFVTAMTVGRGRAPRCWTASAGCRSSGPPRPRRSSVSCSSSSAATSVLVGPGILVWGLGASLGFPVGMSAAADDPSRAAARVSVVATIGYAAFLAGPPLLGLLGDQIGTLARCSSSPCCWCPRCSPPPGRRGSRLGPAPRAVAEVVRG